MRTVVAALVASAAAMQCYLVFSAHPPIPRPTRVGSTHNDHRDYLRYMPGMAGGNRRVDTSDTSKLAGAAAARAPVHVAIRRDGERAAGVRVVAVPLLRMISSRPRIAFDDRTGATSDPTGRVSFDLPPGPYRLCASDGNGHEGTMDIAVGVKGFAESFTLELGRARLAAVRLDPPDADVSALLVAGPDPVLYRRVPFSGGESSIRFPVPGRTVLAIDRRDRIVGRGRLEPGSPELILDCPGGDTSCRASRRCAYIERLGQVPTVLFCFPRPMTIIGRVPGELVDAPRVGARQLRIKAEVDESGKPWPGADVRCDRAAVVLGELVDIGVDRVWTDANGEAALQVPAETEPDVRIEGILIQPESTRSVADTVFVRGSPRRVDSWYVGESRGELTIFVPEVGLLKRRADALGLFAPPVGVNRAFVLLDWPGRNRRAKKRLMYIALGDRTGHWTLEPDRFEHGTCTVLLEGASEGLSVAVASAGASASHLRRYGSRYESKGYVLPLRKPGDYMCVASPAGGSAIAIIPFPILGRAEAQVIRASIPHGGVHLQSSEKTGPEARFSLLRERGGEWHVLWSDECCPEVVLLPPGRYAVHAQDRGRVALARFEVRRSVEACRLSWGDGCRMRLRAAVGVESAARGVEVVVDLNDDESVVFRTRNDGHASFALPRRSAYRARSRYHGRLGIEVSIPALKETVERDLPLLR